jgi:hypothetical protein
MVDLYPEDRPSDAPFLTRRRRWRRSRQLSDPFLFDSVQVSRGGLVVYCRSSLAGLASSTAGMCTRGPSTLAHRAVNQYASPTRESREGSRLVSQLSEFLTALRRSVPTWIGRALHSPAITAKVSK